MPYKEKLKNPSSNPRKKPKYRVMNWTEYNKSLKKRGELSLYLPHGNLRSQFINETPYVHGLAGRQATYNQPYIELVYMFYRLFGWRMSKSLVILKIFGGQRNLIFLFPVSAI